MAFWHFRNIKMKTIYRNAGCNNTLEYLTEKNSASSNFYILLVWVVIVIINYNAGSFLCHFLTLGYIKTDQPFKPKANLTFELVSDDGEIKKG